MNRRRMSRLGIALGFMMLLGGCQGRLRETVVFPTTWPGSQPLDEHAPTVSVQPLEMEIWQADDDQGLQEGLPTAAVLTALLVKHLHVNEVNAILERAETSTAQYELGCAIRQLGHEVREGYPPKRLYEAELACKLRDEQMQEVIWERSLTQRYEETQLLDLMTKLPPQPHEHDRILFRECIVPLWDSMAASLRSVLRGREQLSRFAD